MLISQRIEIFPNTEQKELLAQCFGVRRFVFNKARSLLISKYGNLKDHVKEIKKKELTDLRNQIRKDYNHFTSLVPSQIAGTSIEDLQRSLDSLWRKGKEVHFKRKKDENTCRIERKTDTTFNVSNCGKYLKVVKLGNIKLSENIRYPFNDNIKLVTIYTKANRYFLSLTMEVDRKYISTHKHTGKKIAFDWGIKTFLTGYDGEGVFEADFDRKKMDLLDKNIKAKAKSLSHRKFRSKNWFKAKTKLEQAYMNRTNYQEEFIKTLANEISQHYDEVILEDLNMSFMLKNHKIAKKASEKMYYKFKSLCSNILSRSDKVVNLVDKSFPSTQMCSCCGYTRTGVEKLTLKDRLYKCQSCGFELDRDENAAINLFQYKGNLTQFK